MPTSRSKDLQDDLNAPSSSTSVILPLLVKDMVANSETVNASTVGSPSVSAGGSNVGNGQLVCSKKNVSNADDERIIAETVLLTCVSSSTTATLRAAVAGVLVVGLPKYGHVVPAPAATARRPSPSATTPTC
jgi:hypothetical protein